MNAPDRVIQQIADAYRHIAESGYRPGSSDHRIGSPGPVDDSDDLQAEMDWFIDQSWHEEEQGAAWLGVPSHQHRRANIYAVWAIRALNAEGSPATAARLLRLALAEVESQ